MRVSDTISVSVGCGDGSLHAEVKSVDKDEPSTDHIKDELKNDLVTHPGFDVLDAATKATSRSTAHASTSKLENALRNLNVNELSAEDDDEKLSPSSRSAGYTCQRQDITSDFQYDMSHRARGKAVIVNNVNFAPETEMGERTGSEKDADELVDAVRSLGFSTERYSDLTRLQLLRIFQNVSAEDHSDVDCFMFSIMSHGADGGVIYCTDGVLCLEELIHELRGDRCKTLIGKPKIFFIQACRGERLDCGVELPSEDITDEVDSGGTRLSSLVIPLEADFLVAYSSPPGYFSWRNVSSGAWFIQALIKVLKDHGNSLEINQLLTRVNHEVAYRNISNSSMPDFNKKKQMPYYTSTLTKELYFASHKN
ncbi:caspase-7-like [Acanthaster planci]|uniref:Caspase-7-like n=1 Tax=Acanthaster planci TaxID=133434 RepID=A0A8B7YQP4_ACAPL|nr:caspase-7-like [Acanthaster planci]